MRRNKNPLDLSMGSVKWKPYESTLGASKWASAIGIYPYETRRNRWLRMTGRKDREVNPRLQFGQDNEAKPVKLAEMQLCQLFDSTGDDQQRFVDGRWHATPDGVGTEDSSLLEVKCRTVPHNWETVEDFHFYMPQIQAQLMCAQRDWCYFVAWRPEESRIWKVPFCDVYLAAILPWIDHFIELLDWDIEPPKRHTGKKKREEHLNGLLPKCQRLL